MHIYIYICVCVCAYASLVFDLPSGSVRPRSEPALGCRPRDGGGSSGIHVCTCRTTQ